MHISRKWSSLLFCSLLASAAAHGQCLYEDPSAGSGQAGGAIQGGQWFESQNGQYIYPHGVLRALVILVELDYDDPEDDPVLNGTLNWPAHALPVWANNPDPDINLFDHNVPLGTATGLLTRYFQDASSGQFNVVADYLLAPNNGGIYPSRRVSASGPCGLRSLSSLTSCAPTTHLSMNNAARDRRALHTAYL